MNFATIVVLLAVAEALIYAVWKTFFSKNKTGLGGCSGNCEECGKCKSARQIKKRRLRSGEVETNPRQDGGDEPK